MLQNLDRDKDSIDHTQTKGYNLNKPHTMIDLELFKVSKFR